MKVVDKILKYISIFAVVISFLSFGSLYVMEYFFTSNSDTKSIKLSDDGIILEADVNYELSGFFGKVYLKESTGRINNTAGAKSHGINIEAKGKKVESAKIEFKYNSDNKDIDPQKLGIAYYNEELGRMELLKSNVDTENCKLSVNTKHFSEYVVVETDEWYEAWLQSQLMIRDTKDKSYFNIAFALDKSGSMEGEKNDLSKLCTNEFIYNLYDNDMFSVLAFDSQAELVVNSIECSVENKKSAGELVDLIDAGGGTEINKALEMGGNILKSMTDDKKKMIILLSDGQSSVDDEHLEALKNNNITVITVGFGDDADEELLNKIAVSTGGKYYSSGEGTISDIFELIREEYLGTDLSADSDGDKLPDKVERIGMRNQFGNIIKTDPNSSDTDGDGKSDGEEMGSVIVDENVSQQDKDHGLTRYVYFKMKTHPLIADSSDESVNIYTDRDDLNLQEGEYITIAAAKDGDIADITIKPRGSNMLIVNALEYDGNMCSGTFCGKSAGEETIDIIDMKTKKTCASLKININKQSGSTYTIYNIPNIVCDGYNANFADFNGLYIDGFKATDNKDGSKNISFDVYNTSYVYGVVEVYNSNGSIYNVDIIDKMSNNTGIKGVLIDGSSQLINDIKDKKLLTYKQESGYSKHSPISVDVPKGGYIKITNDIMDSFIACAINSVDIVFGIKSTYESLSGYNSFDSEETSEKISKKLITSTIFSEILKEPDKYSSELTKDISKEFFAAPGCVGSFVDTLSRNLDSLAGGEFKKMALTTAASCGISIAEASFENLAGPAGLALKGIFAFTEASDVLLQMNDYIADGSGSIKVDVPSKGDLKKIM